MNTNYKSLILAISLFFALTASISAAPGDLDPTFGNGGKRTDWAGYARGVAIQPDGKIVVVGTDSPNYPIPLADDFRVARYNPDGTPDTTFGGGTGRVTTDFNGNYDNSWSVVIQPDGKIIVAGVSQVSFAWYRSGLALARYNPDGSLDTTFAGGSGKILTLIADWYGLFWTAADVAIQPDGKILAVAGNQDGDDNSEIDGVLTRYNADGSLDTSFGAGGSVFTQYALTSVAVQPADRKIVVLGNGVERFNTDGSLDTGFGSGGTVAVPGGAGSIAIDSAGKIVVAGIGPSQFALVRLNLDGSPDSSFDGDGIVTTPSLQWANSVVIQSDGKIVAAGYGHDSGNYDVALARYNSNGSLDNTFGGGDGITTVDFNNSDEFGIEVVLDNQGRAVVVGGSHSAAGRPYVFAIARVLGDSASTCSNPIDCPDFFIRQQYRDFLGREAEPAGLQFYLDILNGCHPSDLECTRYTRGALSANFFRSPEFHRKGNYVMYLYMVSIGQRPVTAAELNLKNDPALNDRPNYEEFMTDLGSISTPNDDPVLTEQKKNDLANNWMTRPQIVSIYGSLSNAQFVQKLIDVSGVTPANQNWVADLNAGTKTRAQVLRLFAESPEVDANFYKQSFVTMEYFGYLRRKPEDCHDPANWGGSDPSQCGFIFHNHRFTLHPDLHVIQNIIVRGFIESPEYRRRFGAN